MASPGVEGAKRRKAMWLYPKAVGFNPPERWGHSACFFDGIAYVFGGCCGGLHFSDVLTLDLDTMTWSSLVTSGQKPGTRDSHSTAIAEHKMIVFGGTNGLKKVNDLHVLDLRTKEWSKPGCIGTPPSPRESHTATIVGDHKLVIFGGSGEGEANYLNDVHILDIKSMTWTSPDVKGDIPLPRDSHTATAIGNKLVIYGGDCGNRYHRDVDVLDTDSFTWSRLRVQGSSPGVRAGHSAVNVGSKVYIIGGVGDKQYYCDVWVLDLATRVWTQLEICGQQPQGRFAHAAIVANTDIAIYGGCGEDERPLNELLILQLGSEHPNGRYNISMCKIFGNHWSQERRKFLRTENWKKDLATKNGELSRRSHELEAETRKPPVRNLDNNINVKWRKTGNARGREVEMEQEEHSVSVSQHSSPSQSDQDQNAHKLVTTMNVTFPAPQQAVHLKLANGVHRAARDAPLWGTESPQQLKTEQFVSAVPQQAPEMQFLSADHKPKPLPAGPSFIGAEVLGTVDGAFDSGFLMTAVVKGQLFRGVLFSPGPGVMPPRPAMHPQILTSSAMVPPHQPAVLPHTVPLHARPAMQATAFLLPDCGKHLRQAQHLQAVKSQTERQSSDLKDVVLTLGGPGGGA